MIVMPNALNVGLDLVSRNVMKLVLELGLPHRGFAALSGMQSRCHQSHVL